jgi:hypothetical protein
MPLVNAKTVNLEQLPQNNLIVLQYYIDAKFSGVT